MSHSVLFACTPAAKIAAQDALCADDIALTFVHSVDDAISEIKTGQFSIVVGTLQFDDSRLFELLPAAKASGTPIIAIKMTVSYLPLSMISHSFGAALLSGFDACLDVEADVSAVGRDRAYEQFRQMVRNIATRSGRRATPDAKT